MIEKAKYFAFLLGVGLLIYILTTAVPVADNVVMTARSGVIEFSGFDFDENIALAEGWESYPGKLYQPHDFFANATVPPVAFTDAHERTAQFGTHRLVLKLPPHETYGITFRSLDYATKVYINGNEMLGSGAVGSTGETTIPRTDRLYYYITPQTAETEIILQYSNFVHKEGGRPTVFAVGSVANIMRMVKKDMFSQSLCAGMLLAVFLYNLGIFVLHRRRREFLYFALTCLLFMLRANLIAPMFFPNYNWHIAIRFEYIVIFTAAMFFSLLFRQLHPTHMNKKVLLTIAALLGLYDLIIIVTPPTVFSLLLVFFQPLCVFALLYVLVMLGVMAVQAPRLQNILSFSGVFVFMTLAVNDILALNNLPNLGSNNLTPIGTVIFMLVYMIILSTEMAEKEKMLELAQIQTENQLALQTNRYEQIVANIEKTRQERHDLRHHLSVVSAYVEKNNYESLKTYLADYLGSLPKNEEPPYCQNHAVDAVVRHYAARARAAGAEIEIEINLPRQAGVPDSDLCIVFGNILENAAKAIERQNAGRKYVKAKCETDDSKIVITVDNSVNVGEKQRSGIGLKSVRTVAEKSDGGVLFESGVGIYQSSVLINVKR